MPISQLEARRLAKLVTEAGEEKRTELVSRFDRARQRLRVAGLLSKLQSSEGMSAQDRTELGLEYFHQRIACPFLEEESCSIYAERPIACREYLVTSPAQNCADPTPKTVQRVKVPMEVSKAVKRAQYESDLAQRRYMRVDPANRLVADSLEADWNHKLRALTQAHEDYSRRREQDARVFTHEQRATILALASDFPRLWRDPSTPDRERKRMIRLLVEDVTLNRHHQITLQIRFKGGAHKTLHLPLPLQSWKKWVTPSAVIDEIDQLLNHHTPAQIAAILNGRGIVSGASKPFNPYLVARLQRSYGLKPRYDRLREAGLLTLQEMADALHISPTHVKIWNRHGLIRGHAYSDKNECLYEPPGDDCPRKAQGTKLSLRRPGRNVVVFDLTKEVQCET